MLWTCISDRTANCLFNAPDTRFPDTVGIQHMCLISANGMSLNNFPSHYLGLILKQNAIIFFFSMLPSLIAFFCTECFSISLLSKGQLEFSLFLTDCITTSAEFRNIWNAQPTRPDLEPKSHTWTPCKSAFPGFSFFSFGLLIEKHSNTVCPEI